MSKIYLNLGIIATQQEDYEKAIYLHEKCIENKLAYIGENSDEVMNSYVLLAHNYMKNEDHLGNISYLEKALQICRTINGDYTETTAYSMVQVADAY